MDQGDSCMMGRWAVPKRGHTQLFEFWSLGGLGVGVNDPASAYEKCWPREAFQTRVEIPFQQEDIKLPSTGALSHAALRFRPLNVKWWWGGVGGFVNFVQQSL